MSEEENNIDKLFEQRAEIANELEGNTMDLREKMLELQDKIKEIEDPYNAKIESIETKIRACVLKSAQSISTRYGHAQFRNGYVRVIYDTKKLDGYAASHPEINAFRKETKVDPTVVLKFQ